MIESEHLAQSMLHDWHSVMVYLEGRSKDTLKSEISLKYQRGWQVEDASHSFWVEWPEQSGLLTMQWDLDIMGRKE